MISYPHFEFASVPRTGSTWFLNAAETVGLGRGFKSYVHVPFPQGNYAGIRVSLIRNPADWLRSYFVAIHPGKIGVSEVDRLAECRTESFTEFVNWYLKFCPGQFGRLFAVYESNVVLRLEDTPWNFVEFMESFKPLTRQQVGRVTSLTAVNCSKRSPEWRPELRARVIEAEAEICDRYEYY